MRYLGGKSKIRKQIAAFLRSIRKPGQVYFEPCVLAGCPEGRTVLDPFAGSGATLAVAERLGRNSVGIELNPAYIVLAEERIAQTRAKMALDKPNVDGVH